MDTPHLVDVTDRPHPEFKRHPFKFEAIDRIKALSGVPYDVSHVEDVRSFYHYKLEDLGIAVIFYHHKTLCDKNKVIKEQFKRVTEKGFHHALNFINDFDDELVRYVFGRIHD